MVRDAVIPARMALAALIAVVLTGAVASSLVVARWRDDETLWRTTVQAYPRSPLGQLQLGRAMLERWSKSAIVPTPDELREASAAFAAAYELNPRLTEALVGQGMVAARQGDYDKAREIIRKAEQRPPADPRALGALREFVDRASALDRRP
jgi:tetratricopeptide (TPR) repeat protein